MLILTRRKDQAVAIGDQITVTVVEIRDDKVRLGFVVPKEMPLYRQEVHEAIHPEPNFSNLALMGDSGEQGHPPKKNGEPTSVTLSHRQFKFLNSLAQVLKKKTGTDFDASAVAQGLIDAVEELDVDLTKAACLQDFKKLLAEKQKGSEDQE
jgi:carbon storage regulator